MKKSKTRNLTKQIICITIVLMLCNFIVPHVTYAADKEGGIIFDPLAKVVTFLCDSIMQFMQEKFTTTERILQENGTYNFQYSPAIIFSGDVLAFDINFIEPNEKTIKSYSKQEMKNWLKENRNNFFSKSKEYQWEEYEKIPVPENCERIMEEMTETHIGKYADTYTYYRVQDDDLYVYFFLEEYEDGNTEPTRFYYFEEIYDANISEYVSTAKVLQPIIVTWYNALRKIALVGLLSVLVYVGIRILLLSTSGKESSKYKKMLLDWLIAICLLFTLHYVMSITISITGKLSDLFNTGETDPLLNTIRGNIQAGETWKEVIAQVIMYVVLTIYTIVFSFQYLKRVLYMAFFTMIAPLITLTYPLDKIKDGKAQAFTMWIREYIFNALIQVIHLVVYYILVGSAKDLVSAFPLYAIVAIGFITQGEKIIRKMFGFDNATTIGAIGAAATGGLVAGAMNKLQAMSKTVKKASTSSGSSNKNVRTVSNNTFSGNAGNSSGGNNGNGFGAVANKYGTRAVKGAIKGTAKGFAGATGAMLGFASGVAQGDISAALTGAVAGGKAGSGLAGAGINMAKNIPGGIKDTINNITDTWNEGAYGSKQAQSMRELREFKSSSTYSSLKETFGDDLTDDKLGAMLDAGIKEKGDIEKVLASGNVNDAIGYYTLAKKCPDDIYYDDQKLQTYLQDLGLSQANIKTMRDNMRKFR